MPYIIENGVTRFVTKEEIDAYNKANPIGSLPVAPAGGNLVNVTPNQAEIDNQKITVENGRGSLQDREQALSRARTAGASPAVLAELQQGVENQRRANAFNEETLATIQGQVPQQFLVPNTTNTSPDQPLPETSQPYSALVSVPPGADPEFPETDDPVFVEQDGLNVLAEDVPTEVGEDDLVLLNTGQNLGVADEAGFVEDPATGLNVLPEDIPAEELDNQLVDLNTGETLTVDESGFTESSTGLNILPEDQPAGEVDGYLTEFGADGDRVLNPEEVTVAQEQASTEFTARQRARQQQAIASQRRQVNNGDWRVRIRLAPQSTYLYNAPQPGILQPLTVTDGVIFPYTPTISTAYKANYAPYDLTHSNYKGYFYQSSNVDPITVTGTFTAQDTAEANYLLAVITFFKSATKMFYGQDAERGAPPPLVYFTGLGEYQFNEHPCLIQNFTYTLPADVDYIRAGSPGNIGTNLTTNRDRQSVATNGVFGSLNRLAVAFLTKGAIPNIPAPPTLGLNRPTYVPTKMEISVTMLPTQSRQQVSKQFSVKEFANGNLIKGGFW
jgi:hypothetical protein